MERVVINGRGYYIGECKKCGIDHKQRVDYGKDFLCPMCRAGICYKEGDKVGLFTFSGEFTVKRSNGKNKRFWELICECGNKREYSTNYIRSGKVNNCGCLTSALISKANTKHGKSHTRVYSIWSHIKKRCYNKKSLDYNSYGGRGITMCLEWVKSPSSFIDWSLDNGYDEHLTIDRINKDGNYEPSNCQWITNELNAKKDKVKLNEREKIEVCTMFKNKCKQLEIAKYFNVSIPTIQRILKELKCSRV